LPAGRESGCTCMHRRCTKISSAGPNAVCAWGCGGRWRRWEGNVLGGWDEMGLDPSILVGYEEIVVSRGVGLVFDDILVGFDAALSRPPEILFVIRLSSAWSIAPSSEPLRSAACRLAQARLRPNHHLDTSYIGAASILFSGSIFVNWRHLRRCYPFLHHSLPSTHPALCLPRIPLLHY
jgi:hypothetical protein